MLDIAVSSQRDNAIRSGLHGSPDIGVVLSYTLLMDQLWLFEIESVHPTTLQDVSPAVATNLTDRSDSRRHS